MEKPQVGRTRLFPNPPQGLHRTLHILLGSGQINPNLFNSSSISFQGMWLTNPKFQKLLSIPAGIRAQKWLGWKYSRMKKFPGRTSWNSGENNSALTRQLQPFQGFSCLWTQLGSASFPQDLGNSPKYFWLLLFHPAHEKEGSSQIPQLPHNYNYPVQSEVVFPI